MAWAERVRHDLMKRLLWAVRDLQAEGAQPGRTDLPSLRRSVLDLCDDEGDACDAVALWSALQRASPATIAAREMQAMTAAIDTATRLARNPTDTPDADARALFAALLHVQQTFETLMATTADSNQD